MIAEVVRPRGARAVHHQTPGRDSGMGQMPQARKELEELQLAQNHLAPYLRQMNSLSNLYPPMPDLWQVIAQSTKGEGEVFEQGHLRISA